MARGWLVVGLASLLAGGPGCMPACEDAGLRRVAEAFEARSPEPRAAGLAALGEACPSLPSALWWHLQADLTEMPDDQATAARMDRVGDPIWNDLLLRTCPRALEPLVREGSPETQGDFIRRTCELDRYELLAAGDVLVHRDLGPFMLYEWLVSQRVDRALARQVVRPLLVAEALPAERDALCRRGELSCDATIEAWGLRPPWSNGNLPLEGEPTILVTASAIAYEGTPVVPLVAGRALPGAFVEHVSPALLQRLATHPDAKPGPVSPAHWSDGARLVVAADEATPYGTLVDIAHTAHRVGFGTIELVARREHGLVRQPLSLPYAWLGVGRPHDASTELAIVVHRDTVNVGVSGGTNPRSFPGTPPCDPPPAGCHDHAALEAYLAQVHSLFPHETAATFSGPADLPLQALVSVVDTARGGERCMLAGAFAGDSIPEGCLSWRATLDLEPPLVPDERDSHRRALRE